MKLADITPDVLAGLDQQEVVSLHRRVHQLFGRAVDEPQLAVLREAHRALVAEMTRRKLRHTSALRKCDTDDLYPPAYYLGFVELSSEQVAGLGALVARVPDGECIDLGGGIGTVARVLQNSGRDVTVIDKSAEAVIRCGQIDVRAVRADASAYLRAMPDDSTDCVYSLHFLEHVEAPAAVVKEAARVSREATVHLVPLGKRNDSTHLHAWRTIEDLRHALRAVPHAKSVERMPGNCALVEVYKHLPNFLDDAGDLTLVPDYVSVVGSSVTRSDGAGDLDILTRRDAQDSALELVIRNALTAAGRERVHYSYDAAGPHGDNVPLFDLVLRRTPGLRSRLVKAVTPRGWFTPPKPARGFLLTDSSAASATALLKDWPGTMLERDGVLQVEQKYNGWRGIVQWDGKRARVRFEDSPRRDRAAQFPDLVQDLRTIGMSVVLDCGFGAVGSDGKPIPRVGLSQFNTRKTFPARFDHPRAGPSQLTVHAFDLMYVDGEDWSSKPFTERRKKLKAVVVGSDLLVLRESAGKVISRKRELTQAVRSFAARPGSEGAMLKRVGAAYPMTSTTAAWAKVKNAVTARLVVQGVKAAGRGAWTHQMSCRADGGLLDLGGAMNTGTRYPKGAVVNCTIEEIIPRLVKGAWAVDMVICRIVSRAKGAVHTAAQLIQRADKANVLQTFPATDAALREADLVKAARKANDDTGAEAGAGAEGNLDYKTGDAGTGVLQEHGLGLTKDEVDAFTRGLNRGTWAKHTDFRMRRKGDDFWEGGELFTPGNNKKSNRFLRYSAGTRIRMNFKVPRKAGRTGRGPFVVKGPLGWMTVGARRPAKFAPGTAGALANTWGVMQRVGTFTWEAGTQDQHYKEFRFKFPGKLSKLSGRWIFTFTPVRAGGRAWMAMRPGEQRMDAERKKSAGARD